MNNSNVYIIKYIKDVVRKMKLDLSSSWVLSDQATYTKTNEWGCLELFMLRHS